MTTAPPNGGIAKIIWGTMEAHAATVHGGKPDQQCDSCTKLLAAIRRSQEQRGDQAS